MDSAITKVPLPQVVLEDGFWASRQKLMTDVTIPYMERILRDEVPGAAKSHAIENFRMAAGEQQGEFYGMVFQDSDVAKWLEAAAYSLCIQPDEALAARVRDIVALVGRAQQPDGYLNTYFTVKHNIPRWTNLLECHELYCAGHLIEAAVALHEAAGMDELLEIVLRLVDHIEARFGEDGTEGIPGHQEIELALLRLYRVTGDVRHRDLAMRFLNLRGQDPEFFQKHTPDEVRGFAFGDYGMDPADNIYNQSDVPVRRQQKPRGHAVRQVYMLAAMADAAAVTGDSEMAEACRRMFDAITQRQMYVTGSIGSTVHLEAFTDDYHLPGDTAYGETCASVAMAFFASNLLQLEPRAVYGDILELELYNGALAGMQLDGTRFFYVNPLEVHPRISGRLATHKHVLPVRPKWHACACCPPNLARLITSLGSYLYSEDEHTLYAHLFVGSKGKTRHADLSLSTSMPWTGGAAYTMTAVHTPEFTFAVRIPGYARNVRFSVNGEAVSPEIRFGYAYISRSWLAGDTVRIDFDMPVRRLHADPRVRDAAGRAALARGPVIYCLESEDNGEELSCLRLLRDAEVRVLPHDPALLGGVTVLETDGLRLQPAPALYSEDEPVQTPVTLRAIPYYAWSNRSAGEMTVWIQEA
ncbi:MAG: glycoside hydrolase family 127 protein [Candidatus Ventricola sp.]